MHGQHLKIINIALRKEVTRMYVVVFLKALASDALLGDESGSRVIHVQKMRFQISINKLKIKLNSTNKQQQQQQLGFKINLEFFFLHLCTWVMFFSERQLVHLRVNGGMLC